MWSRAQLPDEAAGARDAALALAYELVVLTGKHGPGKDRIVERRVFKIGDAHECEAPAQHRACRV